MKQTIIINNLEDLQPGDMLFVKGRRDGFRVAYVRPVNVDNPFGHGFAYVNTDKFDHAERTTEEPEWPDPHDIKLHDYLGADGKRYIYNPVDKGDSMPWLIEGYSARHAHAEMEAHHRDALPLTELRLVPKEEEK